MHLIPKPPSTKGGPEWFTGDVYVDPIVRGQEPSRIQVGSVHFTPGARSVWHTHALGQTLYVTEGVGRVQNRGAAIQEVRAGDIVITPPGEEHWHGAAPEHFMTHISVIENLAETPLVRGAHVTDLEYNGDRA